MRESLISRVGMVPIIGGVLLVTGYPAAPAPAAPRVKQSDLGGLAQNWDKVLPAAQRFTVLEGFNHEAVRDNEAGLVWERVPAGNVETWLGARGLCANKTVGRRKGWRPPSLPELSSLVDPTVAAPPTLPAGHPFSNVQMDAYWSGSSVFAENAWEVSTLKTSSRYVWCARGGLNTDAYRD